MKYFNEDLPTVYCLDGIHLIKLPSGEDIRGIVWTRVTDINQEPPYVTVKMQCNIASNNEPFELPLVKEKTNEHRIESENYTLKRELEHLTSLIRLIESKWWYKLFWKGF